MQDKCPKCGEPLITRTIKKELGLGSIDYPIAQVCPKCNWSRDLTGAGDIVSKLVTVVPAEIKKEEKTPIVMAAPPKAQPTAEPPFNMNKLITAALAILVLGGLVGAFFLYPPSSKQVIGISPTPTATPEVTRTTVQPTSTSTPEVTVTGIKILIKLDSRRGFIPGTKTIKPGDEVIWENSEAETVTIVSNNGLHISNDGLWDNQTLAYLKRTSYLLKKPGTYNFNLKNTSFIGTIVVEP